MNGFLKILSDYRVCKISVADMSMLEPRKFPFLRRYFVSRENCAYGPRAHPQCDELGNVIMQKLIVADSVGQK